MQNFGFQTELPDEIESLLSQIIKANKISVEDIWDLTDDEKKKIASILTAGSLTLKDEDREVFLEKTDSLLSQSSRNEIWERNHYCILNVISWKTKSEGQIPTIKTISDETGLSRVTITKHLKEYYDSETFKEKEASYKFLREKLLAKVYDYAYDGNMRAAKIFMEATGSPANIVSNINNQQNNFIQVNGTILSQETIKNLKPEQLNMIEEILKNTLQRS
ncbi:MAG: hypothetical protein IPP93_00670 [Chitinophagaceae bacterium]|nr:hypothetical protein [Chitinophagaceae bacterium]